MAEIATQQPGAAGLAMDSTDGMGTELYSRRSSVRAPEPNPHFSFPRLSQDPDDASASTSSTKPTRNRRIRPHNLAILPAPSPDESFGSSAPLESSLNMSPGKSRPMSARGGHRRGGSEFIGGDGSKTGPGLMSSSPTKGAADVLPTPSAAGRRRGHAHRRSGAMSTNDFSAFLNNSVASAPPLPGSAPSTPSISAHDIPPVPHLERAQSQPSMSVQEKIEEANAAAIIEDRELASTPRSVKTRPRVGFSDNVEVIPRPLSTISSETASSISTVRPSHSVNGSINSILDQRPPTPVSSTRPFEDDSRPTTSDSLDQPFFGAPEGLDSSSPRRPASASGKALFAKRRASPPSLLYKEDNVSPHTIVQPQFFSSGSPSHDTSPVVSSPSTTDSTDSINEAKDVRKQGRVRSFAGLLARKSRSKSKEEIQEPGKEQTDPNLPEGVFSLDDINFDDDTSTVIHSAGYEATRPAPFQPSPSPIKDSFDKDDSAAFDLDATYNSVKIDENSPSSFANIMRSSTHQHRRTESAPSLSPVQRQSFVPSRLNVSLQMDDVFEEDEEEESPPRAPRPKAQSFTQPKRHTELQGLGVQIVDAEVGEGVQPRRKSRSPSSKTESGVSESTPSDSEAPSPATGQAEEVRPDLSVEIANVNDEPRFSMITKSSDEDTITPTGIEAPSADDPALDPPSSSHAQSSFPHPLDFAPPPSLAPHGHHNSSDFSSASSAPSPDPTTISFDGPRLNTAASSITDRTNWSATQPTSTSLCPESGVSTEDVPSLISSSSTVLSNRPSRQSQLSSAPGTSPTPGREGNGFGYHAHTFSGMPSPLMTRPQSTGGDRTFSFGGISPRPSRPRNWGSRPSTASGSKRASLASLSRLMSKGGESERSKLSISWGAADQPGNQAETEEGKKKESRGKRLSRAFKFWKSKEKLKELDVAE